MTAAALVPALRAGEKDAFAELYSSHARDVYGYLVAKVHDRSVAEDLTSETFVRALRAAPRLRDHNDGLRPWLITIARNLVVDHLKSARFRFEVVTGNPVEGGHAPDPSQEVIRHYERERLLESFALLTEDQRRCLSLRFLGGRTVAETASVLGRDTGAVRALQYRAVLKLAEILREAHILREQGDDS